MHAELLGSLHTLLSPLAGAWFLAQVLVQWVSDLWRVCF